MRVSGAFAQQALGHNSKAVHHAYAKHAEVTVPSLDDWEESFRTGKNSGEPAKPKVVPVDFQGRQGMADCGGVREAKENEQRSCQ